jgi:NADH-ubiquinone oxidoreductase chain 2
MVISILFSLLFSNALTSRKEKAIFYSRSTILTLLAAAFICYNNLYVINLEKGVGLYGGLFNITSLTQSFNIFILIISAIILVYNSFYHRTLISSETSSLKSLFSRKNTYNVIALGDTKSEQYTIIEYPLIILFIICGAVFFMSSGDLISLFIAIELQSYGLYILSTLYRDSEQATWGGLTYFLLGGLSSCFILLGCAILYVNTGTTSLDGIYIITTITDIASNIELLYGGIGQGNILNTISPVNMADTYYINISLIILSVGFLFKVSAAPFHFWSPDVYDAIPTTVTTYVAIIAKISIFVFLLELVYYINMDFSSFSWKNCILVSSLLSLIVGSILGLTQHRIKRVYAFSTINHVGFILLALSVDRTESIQAYIFYIISYTISNLNAFVILATIGYTMYLYIYKDENLKLAENEAKVVLKDVAGIGRLNALSNGENILTSDINRVKYNQMQELTSLLSTLSKQNNKYVSYSKTFKNLEGFALLKDINYSPIQLISQLKGYFYINTYISLSLAITLFSFMGIPPLIGFFAKQMVLSAALDNGYIFLTLIGILTSVIGAAYYLNIVKQMFFFKSDYVINPFLNTLNYFGSLRKHNTKPNSTHTIFNVSDIRVSSGLSIVISLLTLILLLFIFIPNESFNLAKILTLLLFN